MVRQLVYEVLLPRQEIRGFVLERFAIGRGSMLDEETLRAARPESLREPEDADWTQRCHRRS